MECNFENCPNFERLGKQFADRISELEQENAELQEKLSGKRFICKDCMAFAKKIERYKQTLQEIKAIADARCNECKYGKDGITCKFGDCGEAKLHLITQLITKAESEG